MEMGLYVNPEGEKFAWLQGVGELIEDAALLNYHWGPGQPDLPVIYVENPSFSAAGIAYSKRELMRFLIGIEGRRYAVFLVSKEALKPWCQNPEELRKEDDHGLE